LFELPFVENTIVWPPNAAGRLIGRGGYNLRALENDLDVQLTIESEGSRVKVRARTAAALHHAEKALLEFCERYVLFSSISDSEELSWSIRISPRDPVLLRDPHFLDAEPFTPFAFGPITGIGGSLKHFIQESHGVRLITTCLRQCAALLALELRMLSAACTVDLMLLVYGPERRRRTDTVKSKSALRPPYAKRTLPWRVFGLSKKAFDTAVSVPPGPWPQRVQRADGRGGASSTGVAIFLCAAPDEPTRQRKSVGPGLRPSVVMTVMKTPELGFLKDTAVRSRFN
jgi:hypothetical protein